jgi:hypothetical protein
MAKRSKRTSSGRRKAIAKKRARPRTRARKPASLSGKIVSALASVIGVIGDTGRIRDKLSRRGDSETE